MALTYYNRRNTVEYDEGRSNHLFTVEIAKFSPSGGFGNTQPADTTVRHPEDDFYVRVVLCSGKNA